MRRFVANEFLGKKACANFFIDRALQKKKQKKKQRKTERNEQDVLEAIRNEMNWYHPLTQIASSCASYMDKQDKQKSISVIEASS